MIRLLLTRRGGRIRVFRPGWRNACILVSNACGRETAMLTVTGKRAALVMAWSLVRSPGVQPGRRRLGAACGGHHAITAEVGTSVTAAGIQRPG